MIARPYITAWRSSAPWQNDAQVEQDLVLTRATIELFSHPDLVGKIALRGGTALNKLFIAPPCRYSEDIDLVQTVAGPIGPIASAIRERLDPWLGKPRRSNAEGGFTLLYAFDSEGQPPERLRLKVEINTREHFTVYGLEDWPMAVKNPWFSGEAKVATYGLDELMGTKLRALYQRRKGRDLFDLWLCLKDGRVDRDRVLTAFHRYVEAEGATISRAQFEMNLHEKESRADFGADIPPLLADGVDYDPKEAMAILREQLIERLPGKPWHQGG